MLYSVLIHEAPGVADARPTDEREAVLEAHRRLQADTKRAGSFVAATQLSESGAKTVRAARGDARRFPPEEVLVTDGPFAETKELFIGFYVFDVPTLDDALALARRIPVSALGSVEVRPVVYSETVAKQAG